MQRITCLLLLVAASTEAFLTAPPLVGGANLVQRHATFASSSSRLFMSGFGAAKNDKKKSDSKLKPKQQWDRYLDLKTAETFVVAVRVVSDPPADEWLQVGTVRTKDNAYTEAAVIRQRLLISEHARRLFPLQIFAKDTLEWAYMKGDEVVVVAGKVDMPDDIEKNIGFVGLPDPSGFYMKNTESLIDNSVGGFAKMKKKGIVGFIGLEVHD